MIRRKNYKKVEEECDALKNMLAKMEEEEK